MIPDDGPLSVLSRLRARLRGSMILPATEPLSEPPSTAGGRAPDDAFAPRVVTGSASAPRPAGLAPFASLPPAPPPTPLVASAARCDVRYVAGSLYGLAVGDALGTTLELQRLAAPPFPTLADGPHRDVIGAGPFHVAAGQVTDDSQMALALFASLIARNGLDPTDLAARYVAWRRDAFDVGAQTSAAIDLLAAGVEPLAAGRAVWEQRDRNAAGNGALMRTAPIGALLATSAVDRRKASLDDATTTGRPDGAPPQLTDAQRLALPGLAPVGGVTGFDDRGSPAQALLELEPAGVPLATPGYPMYGSQALPLVAQLLTVIDAAAAAGHVYRTLRPEHVYAAGLQDGPRITGVIARGAGFVVPGRGEPRTFPYRALLESPEVLLLAPAHPVSPASDVFSVCALAAFLFLRRTPFEVGDGSPSAQMMAMRAGPPTFYLAASARVDEAIRAGLSLDPAKRPTARQLLAVLAAEGIVPPGPPAFIPAPRFQS